MIQPFTDVQQVLDIVGIFVFALSGGLVAVRAGLDIFGVAVLAWATGLGGGIIRDVFLGDVPPVGISNPIYIVTVLVAGLATFAFHSLFLDLRRNRPGLRLDRISESVKYLDAVGLATFAVVGSLKAVQLGAPPLASVFVGGITAVGGGMIRDVLVGQVPEVLRRELYALPAILGAGVVVVAAELGALDAVVLWAAVLLVLAIRVAAIVFDLNAPRRSPFVRPATSPSPNPPTPPGGTMSQPTTDPSEPTRTAGQGDLPTDGAVDPVQSAQDEVIAELEETLQESEHHDLYPYQGIVLTSFGGPEGPDEVMPFLRRVVAGRGVPDERLAEVAEHYQHFGGRSPINEQNRALIDELRQELDRRDLPIPVLFGNRNSEPFLPDTLREAHEEGMTRLLAITTSAYSCYSSCRQYREDIAAAQQTLLDEGRQVDVDKVRQYWNHPGFSRANARIVTEGARARLEAGGTPYLVFVTHSLPDAMDDTSGPGDGEGNLYSAQHHQLAAAITEEASATLGVELEHDLTYCSRSGPPSQPWLVPDVNDHLRVLHERGVRDVVLAPIGFVSDHMEVVFDLDTEAVETAEELGMQLLRVPTVGTDTEFVVGLVDLALERAAQARGEEVEVPTWPGSDPRPAICEPGCCPNLRVARPAACGSD